MTTHEPEWLTRKKRIDTKLRQYAPAWEIIPFKHGMDTSKLTHHAVTEYQTENGPADYALFVKGKFLGIIEAKKAAANPQAALEQAKRYARGVPISIGDWYGLKVPFLYSSNGEIIWFYDARDEQPNSYQIQAFHTPDGLEQIFQRLTKNLIHWFKDNPIDIDGLRPYQIQAINKVEEVISKNQKHMMLAMATGTGKTFATVALVYRLLESKLVRRVLFLVDRKALAAQGARAFAAFNTPKGNKFTQEYETFSQRFRRGDLEEGEQYNFNVLPENYLTHPDTSKTFVYVSTIQRMTINLLGREAIFGETPGDPETEDDASKLDIPINAFDVVIADECHRGYTSKETNIWRQVLDHFDAFKIGLTATPAQHTTAYFGHPVFRYGLRQAIKDGYLCDYDAVKISSGVRMHGIFLKEGETVQLTDLDTGAKQLDLLEDEREFPADEVEVKITAPDSNRKILQEIKTYGDKHEAETGHFPKTLIFAANDVGHHSHADELVRIGREVFDRGDDFVQKITGKADRPLDLIRQFRNRPEPKVVVTVDMLSTGVDIPSIEYIVFLRTVKSRILWEQMNGRGTRLCPEINKTHFTVFDCFDGTLFDYFKGSTEMSFEAPIQDTKTIAEVIEKINQNEDRDYHEKVLAKRILRIEKNMSAEARTKFATFIQDGDLTRFAKELPARLAKDFTGTMKLLKTPALLDLLENYPRAKKVFIVADSVQDEVSSNVLFRVGDEALKPADYLEVFSKYIKDNPDQIAAIKILLEKPKDWKTKALVELQTKLQQHQFDEDKLQKAHQVVYHVALADIISMVKHAAKAQEPLLTREERAAKAVQTVSKGMKLNVEQQKWLNLIQDHLAKNLTFEAEDFEEFPIFNRHGGLSKAKSVFGDQLKGLISKINEAVAA